MNILGWFLKVVAAIIVWAVVTLLLQFIGGLLVTVTQPQIQYLGKFLESSAALLGFLAGAIYFIWGSFPTTRFQRKV